MCQPRPNEPTVGVVTDVIRLLDLRETPLSVGEVYDAVQDPAVGGIALFVGTVRDHDVGKGVTQLDYSSHPSAPVVLREMAGETVAKFHVVSLAAVHRVGALAVGDIAVIVAVGCAHRSEAFAASRHLIDELKARVPIWKHQSFTDGDEEWVGTP